MTVHILDRDAEPGSVGPDGRPADDALPDFVVLLGPDTGGPYRTNPVTFDREMAIEGD